MHSHTTAATTGSPPETWQLLVTVLKDSGAVCPVGTDLLHVKAVVCLVLDLAVAWGGGLLCVVFCPPSKMRGGGPAPKSYPR